MKSMLLAGLPVQVDFFYVYPWKLRDIVDVRKEYYQHLFLFFIRKNELGFIDEFAEASEDFDVFDLIRVRCIWGKDFREQILKTLKLFTKEDFVFEKGIFSLGENILTAEHWKEISIIMATENHLDINNPMGVEEDDFDLANDAARKFRERARKTRELVDKYKKKSDVTIDFLINGLCAKSPNLSILNVWGCTFYQFRQQLDAVLSVERYDKDMATWMSGNFDMKGTRITHWIENN